jgi:dTDP-4-amino-4,6-dideoxygalactose transaminase
VNAPLPMLDLSAGIAEYRPDIEHALARVIAAGEFIQGPDVAAFEAEMASYLGVSHCVAVHSGTDALVLGLRALGVGPGDEVIVPAFSFCATAEAVSLVGAMPVFVDIDPRTFNLDPAGVEAALSRHTRALLPVHLFGQGAAMDALLELAERHDLRVLEDAAQALGGRYGSRRLGSLGHAAALSFFPSKNLGAFGDGGMLATNQRGVAELCRELREHGRKSGALGNGPQHERLGYNSRLDTLQAAVLP